MQNEKKTTKNKETKRKNKIVAEIVYCISVHVQ